MFLFCDKLPNIRRVPGAHQHALTPLVKVKQARRLKCDNLHKNNLVFQVCACKCKMQNSHGLFTSGTLARKSCWSGLRTDPLVKKLLNGLNSTSLILQGVGGRAKGGSHKSVGTKCCTNYLSQNGNTYTHVQLALLAGQHVAGALEGYN